MELKVHHIGIVVNSRAQIENFKKTLELKESDSGFLEKYGAESIFLKAGSGARIQFLLPGSGTLRNFNGGRGGIHHIAFYTKNLPKTKAALKAKGIDFLNKRKTKGIGGIYFDFVFPNISGINIEFVEDKNFTD